MSLNDKIKFIIGNRNLTPSHFADEIGVQRSSISHILSGRNRPSLEIVQRIVSRFPDLTYEWLLDESVEENPPPISQQPQPARMTVRNPTLRSEVNSISFAPKPVSPVITQSPPDSVINTQVRTIEKILIFYSDKTFTEYKPDSFN